MMLNFRNIAQLGEIAALLEVSGYPKPGNVHRTHDFSDMTFEDFLISASILRENLEIVAYNAHKYYPNFLNKIQLGDAILRTVTTTNKIVNTNTNLGISMLMIPISAGCGALQDSENIYNLPNMIDLIMKNTQVDDALALSKAIVISNASGMENKTSKYDVNDANITKEIIANHVNIYDLLKMSASYDKISYELVNGLPIISEYGFSTFIKYDGEYTRNDITLEIFLTILSKVPDTLISRKFGEDIALNVSKKAQNILKKTDIGTDERLTELKQFDKFLMDKKYNPGTTADFTAASLFVGLVDKYSDIGL